MTLCEKENIVFQGSQSKPKLLVCDMTIPLYASALMEFTKETVNQYLNRAYKIVTGNANEEELNLMMIHICSAHAINSVKRKLIKINGKRNGKVHFGLRFYGRLISCYELDECESLVKHAYKVFTSMYT